MGIARRRGEETGGGSVYDLWSIWSIPPCSRDSPESRADDDDDGDDGDDGFVPGMSFVCSLRRKSYGIVLIVETLARESDLPKERSREIE